MSINRKYKLFKIYNIPLKGNDKIVYDYIVKCLNDCTITLSSFFYINFYLESDIYVSFSKDTKHLEIHTHMIDFIKSYESKIYEEDNYYNVILKDIFEKKFNLEVKKVIPLWF